MGGFQGGTVSLSNRFRTVVGKPIRAKMIMRANQ